MYIKMTLEYQNFPLLYCVYLINLLLENMLHPVEDINIA